MAEAYTFKSLDESLWEMLALWWGRTGIEPDTEPGSVLRTLFEAVAFQVEDLTYRFDRQAEAAIARAAFTAFNFQPRQATQAQTLLRFRRPVPQPAPLRIPKGFRVARFDGVEYETLVEGAIAAGQVLADIPAIAVEPGENGNCPAGAIIVPRSPLPGLEGVSNPQPATGGSDAETLEQQQARFARYIATLQGGTLAGLEAAALLAESPDGERITQALVLDPVVDPSIPAGTVYLYVDNGTASVTPAMLTYLRNTLDAGRPAGIDLRVLAAQPIAVNVTFSLRGTPAALEAAKSAAQSYIKNLGIGEKVSRENLITALTIAHPDIREVDLTDPAGDEMIPMGYRAVLGTLSGALQ
ncbi:baseplate J/gp47 family protein [Meiothermus sp. Pnk-1]|uniref:baseplate J/gp47 family protein n=1 Tax=Meiothermus sp. Pnk-1 TaxID=873128 RepID=UPI000D7BB31B|nr:baseplate J/gp47 family protein [Meiothermus sp. Pnk-1]PZA08291.1 hypothetical protein DNA98_03910 [Meiothermus sp. Pnk-1]